MGSPLTCIAGMATGPRTWGVSGVGVRAGPGRHQGGVQLVVTRPGEASAGLRSKSCNISPSDLFTFLSFSTEMLQFVFRGTAPNISISTTLCRATGHNILKIFCLISALQFLQLQSSKLPNCIFGEATGTAHVDQQL